MRLDAATQVQGQRDGGIYRAAQAPWRWVLHTTEVPDADLEAIARSHSYPPHFWYDPADGTLLQTVDTAKSAYALAHTRWPETNHAHAIQVEVHWRAADADAIPTRALDDLAERLLVPVAAHHGIDLTNHPTFHGSESYGASSPYRMAGQEWLDFNGICGHQHVPGGNDHWDPGRIDIDRLTIGREPSPQEDDEMTPAQEAKLDRVIELLGDLVNEQQYQGGRVIRCEQELTGQPVPRQDGNGEWPPPGPTLRSLVEK